MIKVITFFDSIRYIIYLFSGWYEKYPDNPLFEPLKTMQELVKQGKLGVKTGEGYYKYDKK